MWYSRGGSLTHWSVGHVREPGCGNVTWRTASGPFKHARVPADVRLVSSRRLRSLTRDMPSLYLASCGASAVVSTATLVSGGILADGLTLAAAVCVVAAMYTLARAIAGGDLAWSADQAGRTRAVRVAMTYLILGWSATALAIHLADFLLRGEAIVVGGFFSIMGLFGVAVSVRPELATGLTARRREAYRQRRGTEN